MSTYTTEVRYICESSIGLQKSVGFKTVDEVLDECLDKVFDFSFPIFDENYRKKLEKKILKHYYTREIGLETVGLWKLKLDTRLNEIMPYYNQLYLSELLEFNPLYTNNLTRSHDETSKDNSNGNTNGTVNSNSHNIGESTNENTFEGTVVNSNSGNETLHGIKTDENRNTSKYSDTPQGTIQNLGNDTYLTNATINNGSSTNINDATTTIENTTNVSTNDNSNTSISFTNSGDNNITTSNRTTTDREGTLNYLETIVGYTGINPSEMILKYRKTFLNIDMLIINELEDLFMQLW